MERRPEDIRGQLERRAIDRQNGVILRSDAKAAGLSRSQIDWAIRSGRWTPGPARGSLIVASHDEHPLAQLTSATLGLGAAAWAQSALALWNLVDFPAQPVVASQHQSRSKAVTLVRPGAFKHVPRTVRQRVSTVTLEYALASASSTKIATNLNELVDEALRQRLTTWQRIDQAFSQFATPGRRGSALLHEIIAGRLLDEAVPLSAWSRDFVSKLVAAGLPRPNMEWRVNDLSGDFIAQVDLAYPKQRYAIELDSVKYHLSEEAFETDRQRDSNLLQLGWQVSRFTWRQYTQRWGDVIRTIRAGLDH